MARAAVLSELTSSKTGEKKTKRNEEKTTERTAVKNISRVKPQFHLTPKEIMKIDARSY